MIFYCTSCRQTTTYQSLREAGLKVAFEFMPAPYSMTDQGMSDPINEFPSIPDISLGNGRILNCPACTPGWVDSINSIVGTLYDTLEFCFCNFCSGKRSSEREREDLDEPEEDDF